MKTRLPVLLFDEECSLCVRFTQALKLVDNEKLINFLPIQNDDIYDEFQELNFEDCSETIHLIDEGKSILKGHEAIQFMIDRVPSVSKFSWLLKSDSAQKAMSYFYEKVNEIRKESKYKLSNHGCKNCGQRRKKSRNEKNN